MLAQLLRESNYTVVYTGAGMSTESGLPDFRSKKEGLWEQQDPAKVASTDALNKDVETFVNFYKERVLKMKDCQPHKGHEILADWEKEGFIQAIITQNVDGFHTEAGSENVMELHGTLQKLHCQNCGKSYDNTVYLEDRYTCSCGGTLRPSVILFGEMLEEAPFMKAADESEKADLFIVLGSSLTVTPANQFPLIAKECGAKLVIVNLERTEFDQYADLIIRDQKIGSLLEEVAAELS